MISFILDKITAPAVISIRTGGGGICGPWAIRRFSSKNLRGLQIFVQITKIIALRTLTGVKLTGNILCIFGTFLLCTGPLIDFNRLGYDRNTY